MKKIKSIEMANSNEIYEITYQGNIGVKPNLDSDGGFNIFVDGVESDWRENEDEAIADAKTYRVDETLIILGYGTYSGRKFWQLPVKIQASVLFNNK